MFEWSEEQLMVRDAVRRFVEAEVVPNIEALEFGDMPPYEIIRKLYATFGMDQLRGTGSRPSSSASRPGLGPRRRNSRGAVGTGARQR